MNQIVGTKKDDGTMFVVIGPGDAQGYAYCLQAAAEILESLPFRQGASRLAVNLRNLADLLDAENQRLREASRPDPAPSDDAASQERPALADLMAEVEKQKWCIVPPNQESRNWSVYRRFDGEFGYEDEIGVGLTMIEAVTEAFSTAVNVREASRPDPVPSDDTASQDSDDFGPGHGWGGPA